MNPSRKVRVYLAPLREVTGTDLQLLAPEEIARITMFRFDEDRKRFVLGRSLLRSLVGQELRVPGAAVPLRITASGKPELDLEGGSLAFNLSHSGDYVAVAVAAGGKVGVDIERHSSLAEMAPLARSFLHPREAMLLEGTATQRTAMFFQLWTMKEAYLKAMGVGLEDGMAALNMSAALEELRSSGEGVRACLPEHLKDGVRTCSIETPTGYSAAVAADGNDWQAETRLWSWEAAYSEPFVVSMPAD